MLLVAGNPELIRIVVAWPQAQAVRAKRLTKFSATSEEDSWAWLWENAHFDREKFLVRIPNSNKRTQANFDALIANRVLYPDGTANRYVERYLKGRVLALFSRSLQKNAKGAA